MRTDGHSVYGPYCFTVVVDGNVTASPSALQSSFTSSSGGRNSIATIFSDAVPAPHAARMIFGMLDEMALAWLLGRAPRRRDRGKPAVANFDIARAADWVGALVTNGLERRSPA